MRGAVAESDYGKLSRCVTYKEFQDALAAARLAGLERLDSRRPLVPFDHVP